ncbi:MAG: hypothetical protein DMF58_18395 [Acidobacteria bacterium]|nr:MAG: hypothetical protein DMF58_18395 [Acidobacteriota bacterium]
MIKIVCTSCQKPLSLDETKLPMKEVTFPCPACKTKLSVDRRKLEAPAAAPTGSEEAAASEDDEGFGAKALIVGNDSPPLRQAAKLVGFIPTHIATAQQARDYYLQEFPPVVLLNPAQITAPPLESMQPIISLTPNDRRKSFFILVSENLRTLDGNAAFLYGVNLIVAQKDLGAFQQIYRDAFGYHERLYSAMNSVAKAMNA